ncbi:hypothetical protein RhiTH_002754 [Rhizoctonia solani]
MANLNGPFVRPQPVRGSTSFTAGAEYGRSSLNVLDLLIRIASVHSVLQSLTMRAFGSADNSNSGLAKRGRSSGVHSSILQAHHPTGAETRFAWTEEPSPMSLLGEGYANRGRQTSIEVSELIPPRHNAIKALAFSEPVTLTVETPKNISSLRRLAEAETESTVEGSTFGRCTSYQKLTPTADTGLRVRQIRSSFKDPLDSAYNPSPSLYCPPWRVGTAPSPVCPDTSGISGGALLRPQLLRMSSAHGAEDAMSYGAIGSPLQASLYTGSRKTPTLFMLAIAVDFGLKDPEHDFELMRSWLEDHESGMIRFLGISGKEVTRERIEEAIGDLYQEAMLSPGSNLLIMLTGEGDYTNRMHLTEKRFITDSDIRGWLWKLRKGSKPAGVPATVVLDYCRTNKHIPLGAVQDGVEFIWSCSLGQKAAALGFSSKGTEDLPRSCFLLALMMAAYDLVHVKSDIKTAVNREMARLSCFLELVAQQHKSGPCVESQEPDWDQAVRTKPIHDLATFLSRMNIVPKVYRVLMNNKYFRDAGSTVLPLERSPRQLVQDQARTL